MTSLAQTRSVVVGGGIAGIAAAAALRGACDEVLIVEKDGFAGLGPGPRPGIPQGAQLHNLLGSAQESLERLLPGFCDALRTAGAGVARVAEETEVFELGERLPSRDLGLLLMCAPRPTIERVARQRLLAAGDVAVIDDARAVGLELGASGAVAGVTIETGGKRRSIDAPLVVDASGSRSCGVRWLKAAGLAPPPVDTAPVARWYVSAQFEREPGDDIDSRFWLVFPTSPDNCGGLASPAGPDRWHVSLSGSFAEAAPRSVAEMRACAANLEVPWISDLIAAARPLGPPHLFRKPRAFWRRYDLMPRPLVGLLPMGDAVASLNPLFGQGMSVAARQAIELATLLGEQRSTSDLGALTARYLDRAAAACHSAWVLGQMVDSTDEAAITGDLLREDAELHRRYVAMWHLIEPVADLRSAMAAARGSLR